MEAVDLPTTRDIVLVERAVLARHPRAVIERSPTQTDPSWLTIRLDGRVFVVDLQPVWGICIDELHGKEVPFENTYAYVEKSADAAVDRILWLIASGT
jgi:hypothetical protein